MKRVIRLTEGELRRMIKNIVNEALEDNDSEEQPETINFFDFYDILQKNGWSFSDSEDVEFRNGAYGVRFLLEPYRDKPQCSFEELIEKIKAASVCPEKIITGTSTYRYAPEIKRHTVLVLA